MQDAVTGESDTRALDMRAPDPSDPSAFELDRLDQFEAQSIFIFREAFARLKKLALLWSVGKDSNVMIWLARKAFSVICRSRSCMSTPARSFPRCTRSATATRANGLST